MTVDAAISHSGAADEEHVVGVAGRLPDGVSGETVRGRAVTVGQEEAVAVEQDEVALRLVDAHVAAAALARVRLEDLHAVAGRARVKAVERLAIDALLQADLMAEIREFVARHRRRHVHAHAFRAVEQS